jgi:hypothetical protein
MVEKPQVTHLGTTEGQWPVQAFPSESHASYWAAQGDSEGRRRYVWPVTKLVLGPPMVGERVPEQHVLKRLHEAAQGKPQD